MFDYSFNGVSLSLIRDKRGKDANKPCPVKWRITFKRKQVYYSTGINLSLEEWETLPTSRKPTLKEHRDVLQAYFDGVIGKAVKELAQVDSFTFDSLNVRLSKAVVNTVNAAFRAKIFELTEKDSIGNANMYKCALASLEAFAGDKLAFDTITPKWLNRYLAHLEKKGLKYSSIGMYMRTLRAIVNDAMKQDLIKQASYPFGKGKFEIPTGAGREMALLLDDIKKIAAYECSTDTMAMCRDLWMFSFYCNGANFGDLCRFTFDDIEQGEIYFYRKKTFTKTLNKKEIIAPILPPMQSIIDRWGNEKSAKGLIFPFCNGCTTEAEMKLKIFDIIRLTNRQIKLVTKALDLPDISTYNARHSYATILAKMRVPESYIAESLGHANRTITQSYFGSYSKEERIQYNSMLL
jgi:integrase